MKIILVDFDGTIVDHMYPEIGIPVPGAFRYLKEFQKSGAKLILWTMRSDGPDGNTLTEAVNFCREHGIEFFGINNNPTQCSWTTSPKAYGHICIDDINFGCPLKENPRMGGRPYVDWDVVGPEVLSLLNN